MADTAYVAKEDVESPATSDTTVPLADPYAAGGSADDQVIGDQTILSFLGGKLMIVCLMSFVLLIQASIDCDNQVRPAPAPEFVTSTGCDSEIAYAVAAAVISMVVCLAYLLIAKFSPENLPERVLLFLSVFLFLWWLVAACVLTFDSPYTATQNAYFAIWGSFAFSAMMLHAEAEQFRGLVDKLKEFHGNSKAITSLLACSVIELIAAIKPCSDSSCEGQEAFAIALGTVSLFFCAVLLFVRDVQNMTKFVSIFLAVWWLVGAGVCTFGKGPFVVTGNGFFATWGGAIFSVLLFEAEGGVQLPVRT